MDAARDPAQAKLLAQQSMGIVKQEGLSGFFDRVKRLAGR
jgi:hypothetical protein